MSVALPVLMPFGAFSSHSELGHFKIIDTNGNMVLFLPDLAGGKWKNNLISAIQKSIKLIYLVTSLA